MSQPERVRRLLALYCQLLDDRRYEEWTQLFVPDGLWVLGDREYRGRGEMRAYMDNLASTRPHWRTRHLCTNMLIELDGGQGRATSDLALLVRDGEGAAWHVASLGRYHDVVRQAGDGSWQFIERRLTVL